MYIIYIIIYRLYICGNPISIIYNRIYFKILNLFYVFIFNFEKSVFKLHKRTEYIEA